MKKSTQFDFTFKPYLTKDLKTVNEIAEAYSQYSFNNIVKFIKDDFKNLDMFISRNCSLINGALYLDLLSTHYLLYKCHPSITKAIERAAKSYYGRRKICFNIVIGNVNDFTKWTKRRQKLDNKIRKFKIRTILNLPK